MSSLNVNELSNRLNALNITMPTMPKLIRLIQSNHEASVRGKARPVVSSDIAVARMRWALANRNLVRQTKIDLGAISTTKNKIGPGNVIRVTIEPKLTTPQQKVQYSQWLNSQDVSAYMPPPGGSISKQLDLILADYSRQSMYLSSRMKQYVSKMIARGYSRDQIDRYIQSNMAYVSSSPKSRARNTLQAPDGINPLISKSKSKSKPGLPGFNPGLPGFNPNDGSSLPGFKRAREY